jgi:DNA primase small subunit
MLRGDFGFAASEVKVFFSGHRGYHVHIENERVRSLDSMARKEVVDYVIGLGFKEGVHRLVEDRRVALEVDPDGVGWRQRIVKGVYELLEESTPKEIQKLGLDKRRTNFLIENKKRLLETLKENGWINVKGVGPRNWRKILQCVVNQQSAKIDTVVTTDIHRLIRLIGSLHGKTGFMKVEAPLRSLERFDPLTEAIAFKEGQMIVDVDEAPKFRVGSSQYGPFKNDAHVKLPTAAALFLLCKGAAQVRE